MNTLLATTIFQFELDATAHALVDELRAYGLGEEQIHTVSGFFNADKKKSLIKYGKTRALISARYPDIYEPLPTSGFADDAVDFTAKVNLVKAVLANKGLTLTKWAEDNGINYRTAQAVLNGTNKGFRGEAHRAAVALGLKEVL